jgi:dienelactone hydrolase
MTAYATSAFALDPEFVSFKSADADLTLGPETMLDAVIFRPGGTGPFPAIVALHGCAGLGDKHGAVSARHLDWGNRLASLGFLVVMPDSFGSRGLGPQCTVEDRRVLPGRERVRDAAGGRLWLQSLPEVDAKNVSLLGWSNGGSSVLYAVSRSAKVFPGPDFRKAIAFYPGCRVPFERRLTPRIPLMILIGRADNWTPAAPCVDLEGLAHAGGGTLKVVTYDDAYHDFDHPNLPLSQRTGLAYSVDGTGRAMIGTNAAARADALKRVPAFLRE